MGSSHWGVGGQVYALISIPHQTYLLHAVNRFIKTLVGPGMASTVRPPTEGLLNGLSGTGISRWLRMATTGKRAHCGGADLSPPTFYHLHHAPPVSIRRSTFTPVNLNSEKERADSYETSPTHLFSLKSTLTSKQSQSIKRISSFFNARFSDFYWYRYMCYLRTTFRWQRVWTQVLKRKNLSESWRLHERFMSA